MSVCLSVCVSNPAQPTSGRAVGEGEFACIDVAQVKSQSMAKTVLPLLKASKVPKVPKVQNKMQAAIYTRISTKTNEKKSGTLRQLKACQSKAKDDGVQVTRSVSEVVSGSLPASHRVAFNELMGQTDLNKVYVESVRAVARDAMVAEHYYQMSKRTGKEIIPADMPNLFKHDENPAEKFARRTMCAAIELEKDLAVERMRNGLEKKKLSTKEVTQVGAKKANGRKTLLDKVVVSATKIRKMRGFFKDLRYVQMHLGAKGVVCTCMGHPTCTESSQVPSVWGVVHRKRLSLCQV
jgi:DNA invertase Pin-like site-specific DNA recombinase